MPFSIRAVILQEKLEEIFRLQRRVYWSAQLLRTSGEVWDTAAQEDGARKGGQEWGWEWLGRVSECGLIRAR